MEKQLLNLSKKKHDDDRYFEFIACSVNNNGRDLLIHKDKDCC